MANRITEGFDWIPSGKSVADRFTLFAANAFFATDGLNDIAASQPSHMPDVRTGRFGFGKAFSIQFGNSFENVHAHLGYVVPIGDAMAEGYVGFSFYRGQDTHSRNHIGVGLFDAVSGDAQLFIEFAQFGVIKIYRGFAFTFTSPTGPITPGTLIASSAADSFEEDEWFNVEVHPVIANSGGAIEIRVNTVPKVQLVGADTQNTTIAAFDSLFLGDSIVGGAGFNFCNFAIDDLFVNDTTGATMNSWSGNLRVKTQFMIANGATNDFTIGGTSPAATNWQSVLNQNIDDTKFVYSPNIGDIDLYTADPNLNSPIVRVLQVRAALRQDDSTQRGAKAVIRIGATNYVNSIEKFTNQTFTFYKWRWELSPATGVSLTGAEVNGLQPGIEVSS